MYKAENIADYVLWYSRHVYQMIDNLKLQQVLYFLQADFLVNAEKSLFDNRIEAWDWGAVVPSVYFRYKRYGSSAIPYFPFKSKTYPNENVYISDVDKNRINRLLDRVLPYTGVQLREFVHNQTPWIKAYNNTPYCYPVSSIKYDNEITNDSIERFFRKA